MKIIFEINKNNLNFNFKKYEIIFSHNNKVTAFLCNMIFLKFKFPFFLLKKKTTQPLYGCIFVPLD
jgi:hypothetical protein